MSQHIEKFKVLCVGQAANPREHLAEPIAKAGFEAVTVSDTSTAEAIVERSLSDIVLIISEHNPPQVDGLTLRENVINKAAQNLPFVLLADKIDTKSSERAQHLGVSHFIKKHSRHDEILSLIKDITRERIEQATEQRMLRDSFLSECQELMEKLEPLLLALESHPSDLASISSIFRIVHTIKGASGVLSQEKITKFLHAFEDILSSLKNGAVSANTKTISALLAAYDTLGKTLLALQTPNSDLPDLLSATNNLRKIKEDTEPNDSAATPREAKSRDDISDNTKRLENVPVPTQMLDEFLHLTGETTVIRNMVNKLVRAIERQIPGDKDVELLIDLLEEMHKINATMQTKTAELRKTPMTQVLKKLPRTARDISKQLGKKVKLTTSGDNLRVDTAIAQALSNSLIHMIRNSLDHGIELPDTRMKSGKPSEGTINLSFREVRDHVIVEVSDDGAGIDHERIRSKLRDLGQIDPKVIESMDRERLLKQIFEPGFSTAKIITDVSGRGVGMDMVRTSIEQLRGRIDIKSDVGKGTLFKFTIPIPKSVVIINALIVSVANCAFAIPQDHIVRLLRIEAKNRHQEITTLPGTTAYRLNGNLVPLISLRTALGLGPHEPKDDDDLNIIIVRWDGGTYGLIVDTVQDSEDIVVKSLHACVDSVGAYAGATFLGDGTVGLIIDIGGIARLTNQVVTSNQSSNLDSASGNTTPIKKSNSGIELLLFQLNGPSHFAIPLAHVFRLEETKNSNVSTIGNRKVYRYRDELIPVLDLVSHLRLAPDEVLADSKKTNLIILIHHKNLYATPIARVLDVCNSDADVISRSSPAPGIRGLIAIDERVATVIDLPAILMLAGLESPPEIIEKFAAKGETEVKSPEQPEAVGWGLF